MSFTPTSAPPAPSGQTFTQEQLDQIVGQRVAEAKRAGTKDLLKDLGLEKVEQLKDALKRLSDADKAAMSEADRLKAEAAEAKADADRLRSEAATERHALTLERALSTAGAKPDKLTRLARLVDVEVGADAAAVLAAVEAIKTDLPELFKGATTPPPSEPASGGQPPRTPPGTDPLAKGASLAEQWAKGKRTNLI